MNAKKSVTKMVIVPQHVKHAVNVTKDFSDRAVFANKGAEQHVSFTQKEKYNISLK